MAESLKPEDVRTISPSIKTVGVFVNETLEVISEKVANYGLDFVQLHGTESPDLCRQLKEKGIGVIKVFHVTNTIDHQQLKLYAPYSDFFLFDTKSESYGGTGRSFDWGVLNKYELDTPYFLGGGVSLENINLLKKSLRNPPAVLDVNSRFEITPGKKDISLLTRLTEKLARDFYQKH